MPRLRPYNVRISTPDQDARAITICGETIDNVKKLLHQHDLPVSAFGDVLRLYASQIEGVMHEDMAKSAVEESKARQVKIAAIRAARATAIAAVPGLANLRPPGGPFAHDGTLLPIGQYHGIGALDHDGLDTLDDDEIDAIHKTI